MEYMIMFFIIFIWSFVGILVKTASLFVSSSVISFSRFFFGIIFLAVLLYIRDKKITIYWKYNWIWYGAIGKSLNYIFENIAISMGFAYGNIIVGPIQAMLLIMVSAFYFKEEISRRSWVATIMCVLGVILVSWNGLPLHDLFKDHLIVTLLFVLSAIGAGIHFLSQKILINSMDSAIMNFSVFSISTVITAAPLPVTFAWKGSFSLLALLALVFLGFATGITFYLYANVLKKIPFLVAVIVSNSGILFTLLWAHLFFNEPITHYIISGASMFIVGMILLNIPKDMSLMSFLRTRS